MCITSPGSQPKKDYSEKTETKNCEKNMFEHCVLPSPQTPESIAALSCQYQRVCALIHQGLKQAGRGSGPMGIYDGHTCPDVKPAMVTDTVQIQQLYRMAVKPKRKVIRPKLAHVTQMLGDAEKKLEVKQELLVEANKTIGSLAGIVEGFQTEKACHYAMKATSKSFAGKKTTGDHDLAKRYKLLTKKYKVLKEELATSNGKVENLTKERNAVETVFTIYKDGRDNLGKICAALKIKLGRKDKKNQELEKDNRALRHRIKKLEELQCPSKFNHLKNSNTLSKLAKNCTTNKEKAEQIKAVSDAIHESEVGEVHVGVKEEFMADAEAGSLMIINKMGELDSDEDEVDDSDDAPDNREGEKNATSTNVGDAADNGETATVKDNVRNDNENTPDKDNGKKNTTSTGGKSKTAIEGVNVRSRGREISERKSHKCGVCGKVFKVNGKLKRHMTVHSVKSYTCNKCGKPFTREDTLKRHLKGWYGKDGKYSKGCTGQDTYPVNSYKCNKCEKSFARKDTLQRHLRGWKGKNGKYSKGCSVQETSPSNEDPPRDMDTQPIEAGTEPSEVAASVQVNINYTDAEPEFKLEGDDPIQVSLEIDPEYEAGVESSNAITQKPGMLTGDEHLEAVLHIAATELVMCNKRRKGVKKGDE